MLLPVAVAVASNQILNDGVWNSWWIVIAVALTTISALVTYALTRAATSGMGQDDPPQASPAGDQSPSVAPPVQLPQAPGTQMQLNMPGAGGIVNAVQGGTMNITPSTPPAQSPGGGGGSSS
ncbi:hypothetical protein GCM10023096_18160 [Nonomuraea ferruginea]